jgi:choline dehydrogenase-like flavoprotein
VTGRAVEPPPARLSGPVRRVVTRFAEVVCPPEVRTRRRTPRVLGEFELMLGAMPAGVRRLLGAGLLAFDRGARLWPPARGRRFAQLDDQAADAYLRAVLDRGNGVADAVRRISGLIAMCYYDLPDVKEELGFRPEPYIALVSHRRINTYGTDILSRQTTLPREPIPSPPVIDQEAHIVIVGSGAGGATVAAELAEAGMDVVLIEEGGYHPTQTFGSSGPRALRTLYRDGGGGMTVGRPSVLFAEGRCVGGSTVVNGGMSWRAPAAVLERWAAEGVAGVGEADMAPYFAEVEARLSVGYQDPGTVGRDSELLKAGADAKGWRIVPNLRNQLHCAGTNNCNSGCPTGAKQSMLVTSVPRALAAGARLVTDCRVDRIVALDGPDAEPMHQPGPGRGRSRAAGRGFVVEGHLVRPGGRRGPSVRVRARVVVVAGGAVQTPALLARSGLGHSGLARSGPRRGAGQLGRNLALHPNAMLTAFFDEEVTGWHGVHQAFQIREFTSEGILITANNLQPAMLAATLRPHGRELAELMAGYNHIVTAGPLIEDTGRGQVHNVPGLGAQVSYRLAERDAVRVVRGVRLTAEAMFAAGARRIVLPFTGAPDVHDPGELGRLLDRPVPRRALELFSIHLMGTARMNEDPRRGVVDSFGAVHGVPGLFVADASLFPSPLGINPMETVIALALRNARRLVEQRDRYGV